MCLGFQENANDRLKVKAFYLRLSVSNARKSFPDSLTLYYLPRINGSPLEINGSNIRPDSTAFVTLHRVVSGERTSGDVVFGSRERVRASEGVRFEVYLRDEKLLRGVFRRDERDEWRVECRCVLEREVVGVEVKEAEVCVAAEGREAMREKVEVTVRRRRRGKYCFQRLEEIPEQREGGVESDGCCCCCFEEERELGSDGGDCVEEMEFEMEGVRWAVDVGIWVMCLGVGYLVSKASSKSLMHRRLL
ncbi:uncharacterized protein At1g01500-like [Actinidia eriantha]|uniref:uncharacterized protein At1g01500-like n=1 Tax=Actinidia eriantha TaxID=165200 RepID=UPI00258883A9|nr:uncharacterized protein At1g01500-like [Actinidia eriantha]